LTADPEARFSADSMAVTKFRLAVERPTAGVKREDSVDLIDIVAWQRLAEVCAQYLKKGRLVLVEGRIQNRSFEDQSGQRRYVTEVVAKNMTMLDGNESRVASHESRVENGPATRDTRPETVDDEELASDLPF
jgi:single-strand DNA-binding protein